MAAIPRPIVPTLLIAAFLLPAWAGAQAVTNARIVEFDPSPDHADTLDDGRPAVQRYMLEVYQAGASQPFHTVDMGKPSPQADGRIRYDFSTGLAAWPAPGGDYEARVAAVGPGGEGVSDPSNRFTVSQCAFTLSGSSALFPAGGGGGSVNVSTTAGCTWALAESLSWVTPMSASGSGPGTATYSVAANTGTSQRSGGLTIAGRPYQVTQEGSCSYALSPSTASFTASGGTGSVGVTAASGCAWTAAPGASWISVSTASGSGTGTARYTVAANTSTASRSATVTIAGRSHTVSQAAASGGGTTVPPATGALPSPWTGGDVGSVGLSGSAAYASGVFTIVGAGADIWGSADGFHFVRRSATGDTEVVARVTSLQNTNPNAKAGVMLRATTAAGGQHVILDVKPNGGVEFMTRASAGGSTAFIASATQVFPAWLRLARRGSTFTASVSGDGRTWRTVGSRSVSLPSTVLAGLAVTSHSTSVRNTARLDQVSVGVTSADAGTTALSSPWQTRDIGSVGLAGSASYSSGLFTVSGAGADIWGSADAFRFVYQPQLSGGEIVARVTAVQNTSSLAKAGIMIRDGTGSNARHVTLSAKPGGGVELLRRSAASGSTAYLGGATQSFPAWLRLRRSGTTVTAAVSSDGTTWRTVGSTSLTTTTPLMGLIVNSHNTGQLNASRFDHVTVR